MPSRKQPTPASNKDLRINQNQQELLNFLRRAQEGVELYKWNRDAAKQYVRHEGWLKVIRDYRRRRLLDGVNTPLKFLTLPGPNASDIGYFWKGGVLQQNSEGKLNVAICDRDFADEVANNLGCLGGPLVHCSRTIEQEFEDNNSSLREHFPFDVINLDLCGCLIPVAGQQGLNTLKWLFRLQKGQGFLFLLTTRPEQNPTSSRRLLDIIQDNLQNEEGFKQSYITKFGSEDLRESLQDITVFNQIVIPKVIAEFARPYGYKTHERFAARYRRPKDDRPDEFYEMVCHSLEFEPLGKRPSHKYKPRFSHIPQNDNEERLRIRLARTVGEKAYSAYSRFIRDLPTRNVANVTEILNGDLRRRDRLERDSVSLDGWWKSYEAK